MICGRALGVDTNPRHEAYLEAVSDVGIEAYLHPPCGVGAAGDGRDDFCFSNPIWNHSVTNEPWYVDEFCASEHALFLQWEVLKDLYSNSLLSSGFWPSLQPCTPATSQRPHPARREKKRVQFEDQIDVLLGAEDQTEFFHLKVHSVALYGWADKPWSKKRIRSHLKSELPMAMSNLDILAIKPAAFLLPTPSYGNAQAPLSALAVSSRACENTDDETWLMQRVFKQSPHSDQQEALLDGLTGRPTALENSDDSSSSEHGDGSSSSDGVPNSGSSGVHPPSTTGGRQEVILFHLDDPPIRVFLDWSDYFRMINEIALHFATEPANVVDAYEINNVVKGLPPDSVPIIVHLFPDIAVGQTSRLVLFDLEIHAHRTEPSFRLGPMTQRFVLPIPMRCDRATVLQAVNLERYCEQEHDRCFMWLDSEWWSSEDLLYKNIAHGDHIRIAVPPSERHECATSQLIEWSQDGLTEAEIIEHLSVPDVSAGYSPSPLTEAEVRNLAAPSALAAQREDDNFIGMQLSTTIGDSSPNENATSSEGLSLDWSADLSRIRQLQLNSICASLNESSEDEFLVYTWFIDHRASHICLNPKIVALDDDAEQWEQRLTQPWKQSISSLERVFFDVVLPVPPKLPPEDHLAHILLTQHATDRCTVLLTITNADLCTRFAITVPTDADWDDFAVAIPLLQQTPKEHVEWILPDHHPVDSILHVWQGRGLHLRLLNDRQDDQEEDVVFLQHCVQNVLKEPTIQTAHCDDIQPSCSFTEEFLQAVSVAQDAAALDPPAQIALDPRTIEAQPEAIQILWERFTDEQLTASDVRSHRRVESWFLHHHGFTRCVGSRISLLSDDFITWQASLTATWNDLITNPNDLSFAIVHPTTEDAATGCLAQLIVTQHAQVESRSTVLSIYDSDAGADQPPHTFAIVLPRQITLQDLVTLLHLQADCPPAARLNQCSLWFGRIPIAASNVVNVHMGSAFRLIVSRAELVDIAQLLTLSGGHIREFLQRAVHTDLHIRPADPSFLRRSSDHLIAHADIPQDGRPEWIVILQRYFNRWYAVDEDTQNKILHAQVWYLNDYPNHHCGSARPAILKHETFMWRTELLSPWSDHIIRATPVEIDVVAGLDWDEDEDFGHVHILLTQRVPATSRAAVITCRGDATLDNASTSICSCPGCQNSDQRPT